jgi:rhodanese-related sulfurtransferase
VLSGSVAEVPQALLAQLQPRWPAAGHRRRRAGDARCANPGNGSRQRRARTAELRMPMAQHPARLHELDPDRPVACLCHHGGRSMQVAMFLEQQGFARVANIAGGIDAWSLQVDPTVPRY